MRLERLYRASLYTMLVLATLVLSIDARDYNRFALLYPLVVALAGAAAFVSVDRDPRRGLSRDLANLLGLASFVVAMMEYWSSPETLALALGHWLVYLQLIKFFLPKTAEDDWFLFLLGLVQVVIGVYLSQSEKMGAMLVAWAVLSLWTLGLFHLHREVKRAAPPAAVTISPPRDAVNPYPGLFNLGFVLTNLIVAFTTLALGCVIFLAMPRWATNSPRGPGQAGRHLTGFSSEVQLGRMGEILENDEVVMTVETNDALGRRVRPDEETRWRGVTLGKYEAGRWSRLSSKAVSLTRDGMPAHSGSPVLRHKFRLELTDSEVLFATRPVYGVTGPQDDEIDMYLDDGALFRVGMRTEHPFEEPTATVTGTFEYVVSSGPEGRPQPQELAPDISARGLLLDVPLPVAARLATINREVLEGEPDASPGDRARHLERWLRDSGQFSYTLSMKTTDSGLDPVVDFLVNRKEGHCEYFASALTLMLRVEGIPARMVNGFKGGDWNELFGLTTVRQKHAHSWVEALVGSDIGGRPIWAVLDPTPALERQQVVAQVGGLGSRFRGLTDAFRYFWIFYVVGFDQERQQRLIYGPTQLFASKVAEGFGMVREAIRRTLGALFHFENAGEFFSLRGFLVSFFTMLLLVGVFRAVQWAFRRLYRRLRGGARNGEVQGSGVAFYHRLVRLLADSGIERPASETPREFARRAGAFLSGRGGAAAEAGSNGSVRLAEVPSEVVEAFYRVRFGEHPLDPDQLRGLDSQLDALEAGLKPARG